MTEAVENFYKAIFELEEIRELLRQSAPKHKLTEDQKNKMSGSIEIVRESLKKLEELLQENFATKNLSEK